MIQSGGSRGAFSLQTWKGSRAKQHGAGGAGSRTGALLRHHRGHRPLPLPGAAVTLRIPHLELRCAALQLSWQEAAALSGSLPKAAEPLTPLLSPALAPSHTRGSLGFSGGLQSSRARAAPRLQGGGTGAAGGRSPVSRGRCKPL